MKYLKLIFFVILILSFSVNAFALNLEVDDNLNEFVQENSLDENQKESLKNPFFKESEAAATSEKEADLKVEQETERQRPASMNADRVKERVENTGEKVSEPEIIINGVISASNSRMALLISYQQEKHLLKIGDSVNDYKLSAYQSGKATFIKNGSKFEVLY